MAETAASPSSALVAVTERFDLAKRLVKRVDGTNGADTADALAGITRHTITPGETLLVATTDAELPAPGYDADAGTLIVAGGLPAQRRKGAGRRREGGGDRPR